MKIPFPPPLSSETRIKLRWRLPIALAVLGGVFLALDLLITDVFIVPIIVSWVLSALLFLDAFNVLAEPLLRPRDPAVDQVKRLVKALSESTRVIHEIEREVRAKSDLAQRLEADVERHEELLKLNSAEVEAVAQTLGVEVRRESRRSFWSGVIVTVIFFVLGIMATHYFG